MAQIKVVTENDISKGLKIEDGKLIVEVDNTTIRIEGNQLVAVPQNTVDMRITGIQPNGDKLQITVADENGENSTTIETTLAGLLAISTADGNLAEKDATGILVTPTKVKEAIKGDMLQSLGGVDLGYLIAKDAEATAGA